MNACNASSLPLHVLCKPIGPVCNLNCAYCYYLGKKHLYPSDEHWQMSDDTLEQYIRQTIATQPADVREIVFGWQGGEPTLLGIDFYARAIELQKRHAPAGVTCINTMQTNGTLLDDGWCTFLKEHGFLVGLSIDGPGELHDQYRRDKNDEPTSEHVLAALNRLRSYGVEFNALTVVNRHNANHPRRVYRFLKEQGVRFIQFIPIVERSGQQAGPADEIVTEWSVRPRQYGRFLIEVFDEWLTADVGKVFVQIFDQALTAWTGQEPGLCIFQRQCGRAMVLEHNGDLYSCDHFVDEPHRLGNIHEKPITVLADQPKQIRFGQDKENALPRVCRQCPARFACNGGCPKNRIVSTPDGEPGLNYLCEGYRLFFTHIDPTMQAMAHELAHQRPPSNVMDRLNAERLTARNTRSQSGKSIGRNDPCPCGSGRKYKHCCLKMQSQ